MVRTLIARITGKHQTSNKHNGRKKSRRPTKTNPILFVRVCVAEDIRCANGLSSVGRDFIIRTREDKFVSEVVSNK